MLPIALGWTAARRFVFVAGILSAAWLAALSAAVGAQGAESPLISEFCAANVGGLRDEDGDVSDWIEIFNPSGAPMALGGWFLTDEADDLEKWEFPDVTIDPGAFLIVFASGKDRGGPARQLHASFQLSRSGEYLALVQPDGATVAQAYAPIFPPQTSDVSFGLPFDSVALIEAGAASSLFFAQDDALGDSWTQRDFSPGTGWAQATTGIGFGIADVQQAGELLADLDACALTTGSLRVWPNSGALGDFTARYGILLIETVEGAQAVVFRGIDWIRSAREAPESITGNSDWSVEVWAYNPEIGPGEPMVNWARRGGDPRTTAQLNYGSSPAYGALTHWGPSDLAYAGGAPEAGRWHHIVVTYEGGPNGWERLYVDGELNACRRIGLNLHGPGDADTLPVLLGTATSDFEQLPFDAYFSGALAVVRIHSGNLTAEQVRNNFYVDAIRFGAAEAPDEPLESDRIPTDVRSAMLSRTASAYLRVPFDAPDAEQYDTLVLRMRYDDGFAAYLNGESGKPAQSAARRNAPALLAWDAAATKSAPPASATLGESIVLNGQAGRLLHTGNILAIQGLNVSAADEDFRILLELSAARVGAGKPWYFKRPSPGFPNGKERPAAPFFSRPSGAFTTPFDLSLNVEDGSVIHFTRDGSIPDARSELYTGPIPITTQTTRIRACAFAPDMTPGPVETRFYLALADDLTTFSSNLPIVVIDTAGEDSIPADRFQGAGMAVFERPRGERNALSDAFEMSTRIGMRRRGSSSGGFDKASLAIELWDAEDEDRDAPVLGMPADSDWALYGAYNTDRALIRNAFTYELSNRIGRYAVRTRFVEVFLDQGGSDLSYADYFGVYSFMERVKQGPNRVDVEQLESWADSEESVSGGYIMKIDRIGPYDGVINVGNITLGQVYPQANIAAPEQYNWLDRYLNQFDRALRGANFMHPRLGYAPYIDADSWQDHFWINMLTKNPDGLRLSTYMFKDRNKPLEMGPVWDFDRTMGCADDARADDPTGWIDYYYSEGWWGPLFSDPNFLQQHYQRWFDLRETYFTTETFNSIIDTMADEIREAQVRNFERWPESAPRFGGFQGEIDHMKRWLAARLAAFDERFVKPPRFNRPSGEAPKGFPLEIYNSIGSGLVFYTLDGTDPRRKAVSRAQSGLLSPGAIQYTGPIELNESAIVKTRTLEGYEWGPVAYEWGALAEARYRITAPAAAGDLAVSELNYSPHAPTPSEIKNGYDNPDDFEFLEILNIGDATVDLTEIRIDLGVAFDFADSDVATLAPGEYALVVRSRDGFAERYGPTPFGAAARIAGAYSGGLSNSGETIRLVEGSGATLVEFEYLDAAPWPRRADGVGSSLEMTDPWNNSAGDPAGWRPSGELGGSPGAAGLGSVEGIRINEVLASAEAPLFDGVEIVNTSTTAIDLSGWFFNESNYGAPSASMRFAIPPGTILEAGQRLAFDSEDFAQVGAQAPTSDTLSADLGGSVRLLVPVSRGLIRFADWVDFGPSKPGESFGRWPEAEGGLYPMLAPTLGAPNSGPRVGPVLIGEVHYHHPDGDFADDLEFIEIVNPSERPEDLTGWRLSQGVDCAFSTGTILAPREALVVLSFNPENPENADRLAAFRAAFGLGASARLVGGYGGKLSNTGDTVRLERLGTPSPGVALDEPPRWIEDEIAYRDRNPWPKSADGGGASLQRRGPGTWGLAVESWRAEPPTPGASSLMPGSEPGQWVLY